MPNWLTGILIEKVFKVILSLIQDAIEQGRANKKAKIRVKEIMKEKNPKVRAKRMKDFLK